jgi:enterochelin esterase-like enzyme
MYDAQMLFDAKTTWNHQEWRVDEVLDSLIDAAAVFPTIVVGLHNGGVMRNFEYFPEDPYEHLEATFSDSTLKDIAKRYGSDTTFPVQSDAYLMYMVEEVLPLIHSNFSTYSDPENIAVMGSSMGGLMSMYAIGQYPEVFGSALCMSTHWPGGFKPNEEIPTVFQEYVAAHISADKVGKIYFDFGTETLDGMYEPFQQKVDSILRLNGFHYGENWLTWKFPGASHDEKSWAKRLHYPMMFAFSK